MASRWLRSIEAFTVGSANNSFWYKAIPLWFYHIMGFTLQADSCASGKSFVSTEKNGTGGAFNGSDYTFTDSVGVFAATDANKYLIVKDTNNPVNCGIYRIKWCNSATSITIDFKAGYGEFPTAATNLSWWICAKDYQLPNTDNDYVQLQSPHTSGWAIEWKRYTAETSCTLRIALTGDWAGKVIGNFAARNDLFQLQTWGAPDEFYTFWAEMDTDGNWLHLWNVCTDSEFGTGNDTIPRGATRFISFERITPVNGESYEDHELWVLRGTSGTAGQPSKSSGHRIYNYTKGRGRSWSNILNGEITGYLLDLGLGGFTNNFCHLNANYTIKEPNYRLDGKLEAYNGSYYTIDENNGQGNFGILGLMNGHMSIPCVSRNPIALLLNDSYADLDTHNMVPLNFSGTRDKLLVLDSIVIPWCGLSIRG